MGTETNGQGNVVFLDAAHDVKLNNPLMGTETFFSSCIDRFFNSSSVKLNNPLMGTETCSCSLSNSNAFSRVLN